MAMHNYTTYMDACLKIIGGGCWDNFFFSFFVGRKCHLLLLVQRKCKVLLSLMIYLPFLNLDGLFDHHCGRSFLLLLWSVVLCGLGWMIGISILHLSLDVTFTFKMLFIIIGVYMLNLYKTNLFSKRVVYMAIMCAWWSFELVLMRKRLWENEGQENFVAHCKKYQKDWTRFLGSYSTT